MRLVRVRHFLRAKLPHGLNINVSLSASGHPRSRYEHAANADKLFPHTAVSPERTATDTEQEIVLRRNAHSKDSCPGRLARYTYRAHHPCYPWISCIVSSTFSIWDPRILVFFGRLEHCTRSRVLSRLRDVPRMHFIESRWEHCHRVYCSHERRTCEPIVIGTCGTARVV